MHGVEFARHFGLRSCRDVSQHPLVVFFDFAAIGELGVGQRFPRCPHARVGLRPFADQPGEDDSRRCAASDHTRIAAFERHGVQSTRQAAREHHIGAAVVARDDTEQDGTVELDHGLADLGTELELTLAHGFR